MLLKVKEVADKFQVEPKFVRRLIQEGRLAAVKMGRVYRIKETELKKFINENETKNNR